MKQTSLYRWTDRNEAGEPLPLIRYNRSDFDYAQWEREQAPYPHQHILVSYRRRPWYGRITGLGWFSILTFALSVLAFIWGGR